MRPTLPRAEPIPDNLRVGMDAKMSVGIRHRPSHLTIIASGAMRDSVTMMALRYTLPAAWSRSVSRWRFISATHSLPYG